MLRTTVLKVLGAFIAGLVLALASAFLYIRSQERQPVAARSQVAESTFPKTSPEPARAAATDEQLPLPPPVEREPIPEATAPVATAATPQAAPAKRQQAAAVQTSTLTHAKKRSSTSPRVSEPAGPPPPVEVVQNSAPSATQYPPLSQPQSQPDSSVASAPAPVTAEPPPPAAPNRVELAEGTPVVIRLGETLSSDRSYNGDTFRGTLEQPIVRNGFIIAERGSKVLGHIVEAAPAGRVRGVASLTLALSEINTTDGQRVRIETNSVQKRGNTSTGSDAAKIAGGAALGAIIGALGGGGRGAAIGAGAGGAAGTGVVLATRGKQATLPTESLLNFQLAAPVTITERLNH